MVLPRNKANTCTETKSFEALADNNGSHVCTISKIQKALVSQSASVISIAELSNSSSLDIQQKMDENEENFIFVKEGREDLAVRFAWLET